MKNKAQNLALVGGVIGLIVVAVLLLVGNITYSKIQTSMSGTVTGDALATEGNITSNTNSALSLAAVAPLVIGASLILVVILGFASVVGRM
jgi:hypothetical protein